MEFHPYQQRVVEEKQALDEKITRLAEFMTGEVFPRLSDVEQSRLRNQIRFMGGYSAVLEERIAAFTVVMSKTA